MSMSAVYFWSAVKVVLFEISSHAGKSNNIVTIFIIIIITALVVLIMKSFIAVGAMVRAAPSTRSFFQFDFGYWVDWWLTN